MITAIDSRTIVFNIDPCVTARRQELNSTAHERRFLLSKRISSQENGDLRVPFWSEKLHVELDDSKFTFHS